MMLPVVVVPVVFVASLMARRRRHTSRCCVRRPFVPMAKWLHHGSVGVKSRAHGANTNRTKSHTLAACRTPRLRAHKGRQPHNKGCGAAPAAAAALCTSHALAFAALEICFVVAIATPYGTPHILAAAHRQRETSGTSGRGVLLTSWVESFPP